MEWHMRWTDDVRTLYHLNYYRSPLVPRLKSLAARFMKPAPTEDAAPPLST
jgi:hypothetical protein